MKLRKFRLRLVSLLLSFFLGSASLGETAIPVSYSKRTNFSRNEFQRFLLSLAPEFRYWTQPSFSSFQSSRSSHRPFVLHIVTAHGNTQGEKTIAEFLGFLSRRFGPMVVCLEGAPDVPLDLQSWRFFNEPILNQLFADALLDRGEWTGAEMAAFQSRKIHLSGAEDAALYREALSIYQSLLKKEGRVEKALGRLVFHFRRRVDSMPGIGLPVREYFNWKMKLIKERGSAQEPNLEWLPMAEKQGFFNWRSSEFKAQYPALAECMHLQSQTDSQHPLRSVSLFEELKRLEKNWTLALANNSLEKEVLALAQMLYGLRQSVYLEWTGGDSGMSEIPLSQLRVVSWARRMERLNAFKGAPKAWLKVSDSSCCKILERALSQARRFYLNARARDFFLLAKALSKARKHPLGFAVLVTGGAHADSIQKRMRDSKIDFLTITPSDFDKNTALNYRKSMCEFPDTAVQMKTGRMPPVSSSFLQPPLRTLSPSDFIRFNPQDPRRPLRTAFEILFSRPKVFIGEDCDQDGFGVRELNKLIKTRMGRFLDLWNVSLRVSVDSDKKIRAKLYEKEHGKVLGIYRILNQTERPGDDLKRRSAATSYSRQERRKGGWHKKLLLGCFLIGIMGSWFAGHGQASDLENRTQGLATVQMEAGLQHSRMPVSEFSSEPQERILSLEVQASPQHVRSVFKMPLHGRIVEHVSEGASFSAHEPVLQIHNESQEWMDDEAKASQVFEELHMDASRMKALVKQGAISEMEYQKFNADLESARETLAGIRHESDIHVAFPYSGQVLKVYPSAQSPGDLAMEIADTSQAMFELPLAEETLQTDGRRARLIEAIREGYEFKLKSGSQVLNYHWFEIDGDILKVYVRMEELPGWNSERMTLEVPVGSGWFDSPREASSEIHYRWKLVMSAPLKGTLSRFRIFQKGTVLEPGKHTVLEYDPEQTDRELKSLQAQIRYYEKLVSAQVAILKRLPGAVNQSQYEHDQKTLQYLKKKRGLAARERQFLTSPQIDVPWPAVLMDTSAVAEGVPVEQDAALWTLASIEDFSAELWMDDGEARDLRVGDSLPLSLEEGQRIFMGEIDTLETVNVDGYKKLRVRVSFRDPSRKLREGMKIRVFRAKTDLPDTSLKGGEEIQIAQQVQDLETGLFSSLRSASSLEEARKRMDRWLSQEGIAQEAVKRILLRLSLKGGLSPEIREWALSYLARMNDAASLVYFVKDGIHQKIYLSKNESVRRLFSFSMRLLKEWMARTSLYDMSGFDTDSGVESLDAVMGFLSGDSSEDVKERIALQVRLSAHSNVILERWIKQPGLQSLAAIEMTRQRGLLFLENRRQGLGSFTGWARKALNWLKIQDAQYVWNQGALAEALQYGTLASMHRVLKDAEAWVQTLEIPEVSTESEGTTPIFSFNQSSNSTQQWISPDHYERDLGELAKSLESKGAGVLSREILPFSPREFLNQIRLSIAQGDKDAFLDLVESVPQALGETLLQPVADAFFSSSLFSDFQSLSDSPDFAGFQRARLEKFYIRVMKSCTNLTMRQKILNAWLRHCRTEIELARVVFGEDDFWEGAGLSGDETRWLLKKAEGYLQIRISAYLLSEQALEIRKEADRSLIEQNKIRAQASAAQAREVSRSLMQWDMLSSDVDVRGLCQKFLEKFGMPLERVDERLAFYRQVFNHSSSLWNPPHLVNKRTAWIAVGVFMLLGGLCLRFAVRTHVSSAETSQLFRSEHGMGKWFRVLRPQAPSVLRLFSSTNTAASFLYKEYQQTIRAFWGILMVRTLWSIGLIALISSWELLGNGSAFLMIYLGLIFVDQISQIFLIRRRESLGKIFNDFFPGLLQTEIESARQRRALHVENLGAVFSQPVRIARVYASGKLCAIYVWENILNILSIGLGLAWVHLGIAVGYFGFILFFLAGIGWVASRMSKIHDAGREKEEQINRWMQQTRWLVRMGFPGEENHRGFQNAEAASERMIHEKMKHTAWLRTLAVFFPGAGALIGLPLSTLAASRGLESFFFLPDWAKEMAESGPAEAMIRDFLMIYRANKDSKRKGDLPAISFQNGLSLRGVTLAVPSSSEPLGPSERLLLQSQNLELTPGTLNFIYGSNGSGKTTFLRWIAGMETDCWRGGEIFVKDVDLASPGVSGLTEDVRVRNIHYFMPEDLTGHVSLSDFMALLTEPEQNRFLRFVQEMDPLPLDSLQTDLSALSRGQKDRLQLAFVLSKSSSPVLLLDEAFAHMDAEAQKKWLEILEGYTRTERKIILLAEKSPCLARFACDRIYHLEQKVLRDVTLENDEEKWSPVPSGADPFPPWIERVVQNSIEFLNSMSLKFQDSRFVAYLLSNPVNGSGKSMFEEIQGAIQKEFGDTQDLFADMEFTGVLEPAFKKRVSNAVDAYLIRRYPLGVRSWEKEQNGKLQRSEMRFFEIIDEDRVFAQFA